MALEPGARAPVIRTCTRSPRRSKQYINENMKLNANVDFLFGVDVLFAGHPRGSVYADLRREPHVAVGRPTGDGAISQQPPDPSARRYRAMGAEPGQIVGPDQGSAKHLRANCPSYRDNDVGQVNFVSFMYDLTFFRNNSRRISLKRLGRPRLLPLDINAYRQARYGTPRGAHGIGAAQGAAQCRIDGDRRKLEQPARMAVERQQKVREMGERAAALETRASELDEEYKALLAGVPNTPHESVPTGKSADDNVEVRRWGTPPSFSFEPKPHWDLGPQLGILDFDRAAKITGARFAVYMGLGAKLERALINFMLDVHSQHHGYTEILPPFMANSRKLLRHRETCRKSGRRSIRTWKAPIISWCQPPRGSGHRNLSSRRNARSRHAAHQVLRLHAVLPQ